MKLNLNLKPEIVAWTLLVLTLSSCKFFSANRASEVAVGEAVVTQPVALKLVIDQNAELKLEDVRIAGGALIQPALDAKEMVLEIGDASGLNPANQSSTILSEPTFKLRFFVEATKTLCTAENIKADLVGTGNCLSFQESCEHNGWGRMAGNSCACRITPRDVSYFRALRQLAYLCDGDRLAQPAPHSPPVAPPAPRPDRSPTPVLTATPTPMLTPSLTTSPPAAPQPPRPVPAQGNGIRLTMQLVNGTGSGPGKDRLKIVWIDSSNVKSVKYQLTYEKVGSDVDPVFSPMVNVGVINKNDEYCTLQQVAVVFERATDVLSPNCTD